MRSKSVLIAVALLFTAIAAQADVADSAANGFTVRIAIPIHAQPADVYSRLVNNVGDWWSPDHTFSNDAHNLSIEAKPLGCFCEKLPTGGGVRHMQVIMVMPNKMLVMSGALGPLQGFGATGTMTLALEPLRGETRLQLIYRVGGYLPDGLNTWAAPVDKVLTEQMNRLKNYVETGNPAGTATKQ